MGKKITAPRMYSLEYDHYLGMGQRCGLNDESTALLNSLLEKLSKIQWENDNDRWKFWVAVPRGTIEDFGDYEELHEDGEYDTYEEFEQAWKNWFPNDEYWYEITVAAANGYVVLVINNSIVLNIEPNKDPFDKRDYTDLLQFLIDEVDAIIKKLEEGTYAKHISSAIPHQYRMGTILRKKLWEISPKFVKHDCEDLEQSEIDQFIEYAKQNDITAIGRMRTMTAQQYYDACAVCYKAARFEGLDGKTPKEQYSRYADNRDGGLTTIEDESPDAFEKWFDLSDTEKWKIQNPSHTWEISMGSTHTRIFLYVGKDEQGYYLSLAGGAHCRTAEIVRMYNALKKQGYPIRHYQHKLIVAMLEGKDDVGIVPCTDNPSQYWYGGFPQSNVLSFICLNEETLTDEEINQIIKNATWLEMPSLILKVK